MRMVACGQTKEQMPHWMHRSSSHTGMLTAMLRFSYLAVPVGKVPSAGIAETGTLSPSPSMIGPRVLRTKSGASAPRPIFMASLLSALAGTWTSWMFSSAASTACLFMLTTFSPALP